MRAGAIYIYRRVRVYSPQKTLVQGSLSLHASLWLLGGVLDTTSAFAVSADDMQETFMNKRKCRGNVQNARLKAREWLLNNRVGTI